MGKNGKKEGKMAIATIKTQKKLVKELHGMISSLNDSMVLVLTKKGVSGKIIDPAHVCMVDYTLDADRMEYEFHGKGKAELVLPMDTMKPMLVGSGDADFTITFIDHDKESWLVRYECSGISTEITIDKDEIWSDPKIPKLDLKAEAVVETNDFVNALKYMDKVTDHVILSNAGKDLLMECDGYKSNVRIALPKNLNGDEKDIDAEARSMFPLDYMNGFVKNMKSYDVVNLRIGMDYPLRMDIEGGLLKGTYLLAPRIEGV